MHKLVLRLTGGTDIRTLIQILEEIASFCGENSKIALTDTPVDLDLAHFVADPEEQEGVFIDMMNALAKYPLHVILK